MEEKYVGILMNRQIMSQGVYLFKPQGIIEGKLIEEEDYTYFEDNFEMAYSLATDAASTTSDEDTVVAYPIKESELLKIYSADDLKQAKGQYFDEICGFISVGFYSIDTDEIIMRKINLLDEFARINNFELESVKNEKLEELEYIAIEKDKFRELFEIKSLEELVTQLKMVYNYTSGEMTPEDYINSLFNVSYGKIYEIDDINEMKEILHKIQDMYLGLYDQINDSEEDLETKNKKTNYIFSIAEYYDQLLSFESLDEIKFGLSKLEHQTKKHLEEEPAVQIVVGDKIEKETEKIDVKKMKKFFDDKIIGQESAKRDVISAIFMNSISTESKNSCLLVGPTGSGKTLLAETSGEFLDKPVLIIDSTQLTIPGYVGANIEDYLPQLLEKTNGDLEKAQHGIVVFDEIDKKGSEKNSDVSGKGVLNTLLPFIHGTTYEIKYNNKKLIFDTSNLTIFATGAFTDVATNKKNNGDSDSYKSNSIGFNSNKKTKTKEDIKYEKLETEDFVKYGNMPIEFIGRFSCIAQLTGHTKESLKKILTDSNISVLVTEKKKLEKIGITLTWTEGYIDAVADKALELKTGARSLKNTVEKSIREARWEVINNPELYSAIILTEKTVTDNNNFELLDKEGNSINLVEETIKIKELK